jgi:hypothetical protein
MVQYKCKGRKPETPQGASIKAVYSTVTTYPCRKREIERSHIEGRGEGGGSMEIMEVLTLAIFVVMLMAYADSRRKK